MTNSFSKKYLILVLCSLLYWGDSETLYADEWTSLNRLVGKRDAVLVADPGGKILFSKNADKMLVPASALKVFTALMARHYLGPDYRFMTEFYLDKDSNLKIRGYGDPLLISEVVADIAKSLSTEIRHFNDLILDDSYFDPVMIPGVTTTFNPYDSPNGALCVNFNTVCFKKTKGRYVRGEAETPLLPVVLKRIRQSGMRQGRIVLSAQHHETTLYAGHLFRHFLKQAGVKTEGEVRMGRVRKGEDRLILRHTSAYSLDRVISRLLEYSNNFIANQLFIAAGIGAYGPPGTLEKGIRAATAFAGETLKLGHITLAEGSGISRANKISARTMLRVLESFAPYRELMRHEGREFYKTGSLKGVRTRAGYIRNATGEPYRFVVMVNTPGKTTDGIMTRLLRILN